MALSNSGKVPVVVDLTIDSDTESDNDTNPTPKNDTVGSKSAHVPFSPLASRAPITLPGKRPSTTPIPLLGSTTSASPRRPVSTKYDGTPNNTITATSSNRSPTTIASASIGRNCNESVSRCYIPASSVTLDGADGAQDNHQSTKRRKLLTSGRLEAGQHGPQAQPRPFSGVAQTSKHGDTPSTQAHHALQPIRHTLGPKLNTMNSAPSVYYMNSALKPSGSSVPFVGDAPAHASRPLFIGSFAQEDTSTGLLSPGLTTPENASPVPLDVDPLDVEMELTRPCPPTVTGSWQGERSEQQNQATTGDPTNTFPKDMHAASTKADEPLRTSLASVPVATTQRNRDKIGTQPGPASVRHSTPQMLRQSPVPTPNLPHTLSLAPAKTKSTSGNASSSWSEEEDHLLIFLKEVKRLKWLDITTEFDKDIKGRNYTSLQSHYSTVLNKRNRGQDPPTLNLPSRFAAEAAIDWRTVHTNTIGSRQRTEVARPGSVPEKQRLQSPRLRTIQQTRSFDPSSDTDSAPLRQRSRRAPKVNYTLRRFNEDGLEEADDDDYTWDRTSQKNTLTRSETPTDDTLVTSDLYGGLRSKPIEPDFHTQDASIGLFTRRGLRDARQERLPYLSWSQRLAMRSAPEKWNWDQATGQIWQGAVLHVDLSSSELHTVNKVIAKAIHPAPQPRHSTDRRRLRAVLEDLSEPRIQRLAHEISRHLHTRDAQSIISFLSDATMGKTSNPPQIQRFVAAKPTSKMDCTQDHSVSAVVRRRELGLQSSRGWRVASSPLTYRHMNQMIDTLGPKYTWTGASSDIHTVAWAPNGECFAAGAVAVTDADSMQYNRANNLAFGNTTSGVIYELGEHRIRRQKTVAGANSTHAMYMSQDPMLYTTVSSVAFSPSGKLMYSAGYDEIVTIWDVTEGASQPQLAQQLQHKAPVDILAVNRVLDGLIATATKRTTDRSIKLVHFDEDTVGDQDWQRSIHNFASAKAVNRPDLNMTASALQFDPNNGRLLLAGFGANKREDNGLDTTGDICLWDVETRTELQVHGSSRNVFDVTFNTRPRFQCLFAVGCVASGNVNKGTRSVVRFYNAKGESRVPDNLKYTCPLELECRAYDMNDIVWCPHDENLFAAGCTDGRAYVWDLRMPDRVLRTLCHGESLMPLQEGIPHEKTDTGVRFLSWGQNATRLYSGSSDGVVKVWDVTRSQEDTFVKDMITTHSGIMSGAFTADYSKLVLGEVDGSVNVLEVGRDDIAIRDADKLQYHPYYNEHSQNGILDSIAPPVPTTDDAAAEARHWIQSGQLQLVPMGGLPKQQVIQGPAYRGPYDRNGDIYTQQLRETAFRFQETMAAINGPQCDLSACHEKTGTTTFEEAGDSGRSLGRIPDELRKQWLDESVRTVPGRSKCTYCSRPAIPSTDTQQIALCERCSFTCFRCGGSPSVDGFATTLDCTSCGRVWDVGALGYELALDSNTAGLPLHIPSLKQFGRTSFLEKLEDMDTTFGDEMNALTDYYFGLAIDRPESPPL